MEYKKLKLKEVEKQNEIVIDRERIAQSNGAFWLNGERGSIAQKSKDINGAIMLYKNLYDYELGMIGDILYLIPLIKK